MPITPIHEIVKIHEQDISWLIALWFAVHGGDPGPEAVEVDTATVLLAAALSARLTELNAGALAGQELTERLATMRIEPKDPENVTASWCAYVNGERRCIAIS